MTKRKCKKCKHMRDADTEFDVRADGYVYKTCIYCTTMRKNKSAVLKQNNQRWVCEYDPTGAFSKGAEFGDREFNGTRLLGYWPAGSVWYNRKTGRYYHIEQRAVIFKNVRGMKQFVRMAKERLESE